MTSHTTPDSTVFVIFGGGGDLSWRMVVPALYDLFCDQSLPVQFAIVVVDRADLTDDSLRRHLRDGARQFSRHGVAKPADWTHFASHVSYQKGDFKQVTTYTALGARCAGWDKEWAAASHRIFYMATPPSMFGEIPKYLSKAGLAKDRARARLVVEKPIGYDLDSARALNATLGKYFDESQIFRIDHYLGKETVQNILAFRFANPLFEPIWNRHYIDYVTITATEEVGVGSRAGYYEHAGALRDMVQNHLMQLFCLVAMEPMVSFDADEIRNKKVDVLHAARPIPLEEVGSRTVRGQYGPGWMSGKKVPGYREEKNVDPQSQTETYVALKCFVDNWRWQDVPFYLRTGKRLTKHSTEIAIQFRHVPHQPFPAEAALGWEPSRLVLAIEPEEGIVLGFQAKYPGAKMQLRPVEMRFSYDSFAAPSREAYETLIFDVMQGDATLFMRADQVEAAWQLLMPVLNAWAGSSAAPFPNYAAGEWGPAEAQSLLSAGHSWPVPTPISSINKATPKGRPWPVKTRAKSR